MMRKNQSKDMVKASLWLHKDEYAKMAELSGDMSINLFAMRAIRKAIQAEEDEQKKKVGVTAQ